MLRLALLIGVISIIAIVLFPQGASAHVLQVDRSIGAVLHIPPDDNPQVGEQTRYNMTFVDDQQLIDLNRCACMLSVLSGDQVVLTSPLIVGSKTVGDALVTIDQPGAYTFRFSGEPTSGAEFQPFTLDYAVRVSDGIASIQKIPLLMWLGMAMSVGLVLLAASRVSYEEEM